MRGDIPIAAGGRVLICISPHRRHQLYRPACRAADALKQDAAFHVVLGSGE